MYLPPAFEARMRALLGEEYPAYRRALEEPPRRGLRVNTLKTGVEEFIRKAELPLAPTGLVPEGFLVPEELPRIGAHPLHRAGLFYMQEPSAMRAAALLKPTPGMRVLDLCAAPGGKAGQLAAYLKGRGILVANEVVPSRAAVLTGTLERLGVRNALVTNMQPEPLCNILKGYFDAVLVDAPCSGEGMFRKEPQAIADWSVSHVEACALRQAGILDAAAAALRRGGRLVYSTCTFSKEENEDTVRAFLARHPEFAPLHEERHFPHTGVGEGHFIALLQKEGGDEQPDFPAASIKPLSKEVKAAWEAFVEQTMTEPPEGVPLLLPDGRLMLLPEEMPANFDRLFLRNAGVHAADDKNGRFTPAHALALAYPAEAFRLKIELDEEELTAYFLGNTLNIPEEGTGFAAVLAKGHPVGWGKVVQEVLKNHYPKGLRG
ncbi:MAG TPA: RsmF rRNA methyltransferase first C-terminal domain-containing protein [Feifaniaceae bacterium]|nr:RsmF rRNA methyltransferase first C-terminal domain-containing protein [Feifaniaceae bacterium]